MSDQSDAMLTLALLLTYPPDAESPPASLIFCPVFAVNRR